jgi:hypothetical protein
MPGETTFHKPYHRPSKKLNTKKESVHVSTGPTGMTVTAQFQSPEGSISGPSLNLPANVTPDQLSLLLNHLLSNASVFLLFLLFLIITNNTK